MSNCSLCKKEAQIYQPGDKCLACLNNGGVCKRCGRERIIRYKAKGWCVSCYQSVWESDKRKAEKSIEPYAERVAIDMNLSDSIEQEFHWRQSLK